MFKRKRNYGKRRFIRSLRSKRPSKLRFAQGQARPTRKIKQAYRMSNVIAEKKVWDTAIQLTNPVVNTWVGYPCSTTNDGTGGIIQGISRKDRIGSKIFCRYIKIRMYFKNVSQSNAILNQGYPVRLVAIVPRDANTSVTLPTAAYTSQWTTEQVTVLWDKTFYLASPTNTQLGYNAANSDRLFTWQFKIFNSWEFGSSRLSPNQATPTIYIFYTNSASLSNLAVENTVRITYTDS